MKKPLLLFILGTGILSAQAQITITSADVVTPTKMIVQATDTLVSGISMGSAGTNQTWNMSALNTDQLDSLTFLPYSAAPNPKFSSANIAVQNGSQPIYTYLSNTSSMLTILGVGGTIDLGNGPTPLNQVYTPYEKLANFPATYNSNFTSNFVVRTVLYYGASGIDSIRMKSRHAKLSNVDAWGTVTTPLGSFPSLRFLEVNHNWDTTEYYIGGLGGWQTSPASLFPPTYAQDSSKSYSWWANSVGFPLVEANLDYNTLQPTDIRWLMAYPMSVGINEYTSAIEMNVYPNPAVNEVNIAADASKVSAIQVYDLSGCLIETVAVTSDITNINTSAYSAGAYLFNVIGDHNSVLDHGKFTIAK